MQRHTAKSAVDLLELISLGCTDLGEGPDVVEIALPNGQRVIGSNWTPATGERPDVETREEVFFDVSVLVRCTAALLKSGTQFTTRAGQDDLPYRVKWRIEGTALPDSPAMVLSWPR